MKRKIATVILIAFLTLLTSCVTEFQAYSGTRLPDNKQSKLYVNADKLILINLDDRRILGRHNLVFLTPGIHTMTVQYMEVIGSKIFTGEYHVWYKFKTAPGKSYYLGVTELNHTFWQPYIIDKENHSIVVKTKRIKTGFFDR